MLTCIMYACARACVCPYVCMCDTVCVYVCVRVCGGCGGGGGGVLFFVIIFSFYRKKSLYHLKDTRAFGNAIGEFLDDGDRGMLCSF